MAIVDILGMGLVVVVVLLVMGGVGCGGVGCGGGGCVGVGNG